MGLPYYYGCGQQCGYDNHHIPKLSKPRTERTEPVRYRPSVHQLRMFVCIEKSVLPTEASPSSSFEGTYTIRHISKGGSSGHISDWCHSVTGTQGSPAFLVLLQAARIPCNSGFDLQLEGDLVLNRDPCPSGFYHLTCTNQNEHATEHVTELVIRVAMRKS